jgi:RNase H-like domain found in reverse transcriptase/Reverse transcriptase (RNA-dependent DNA polymerase)/Integrase zinc binding domain/Chromo (CHRromatin Organisation MOdifier) domain
VGATTLKGDTDPTGGGLEQGRPCASIAAYKADRDSDSAGTPSGETTTTAGSGDQSKRVRFRVAYTRKIDKAQVLLILRGYARAAADGTGARGQLQPVEVRALLDSGAEGDFMSPSLAKQLGGQLTTGQFGIAVGVFGEERAITQEARNTSLLLPGTHPGSGLAQEFKAQHTVLVSPSELSFQYNMLLGGPFLKRYHAVLGYGARGGVELTALDGLTTAFATEPAGSRDDCIEAETEDTESRKVAARAQGWACRATKPPSAHDRRVMKREWRQWQEGGAERAAEARVQLPEMVMTTAEMEALWATTSTSGGKMTVYPIVYNGMHGATGGTGAPTEETQRRQTGTGGRRRKGGRQYHIARLAHNGVPTKAEDEEEHLRGALPAEERAEAGRREARLVGEFPDVFTNDLPHVEQLGTQGEGVEIKLKDGARPVGRYGPRMTQENTDIAAKMIRELIDKGFIRPSKSPWGAPMFLVDKPDGTKRMVIDYRALNAATERNRYPLPRTDELFDQLRGARYFSKIDLRTGYWQIRMAAGSVSKTAFTSRHGHYEWLVLPMGLTNAPAEFMAMMEHTFRAELNKSILCFLDDILIYSRTLEEHEQHLRVALTRLRDAKLHAKLSKCSFFRAEVEFLGHYVGRAGVRMVEGKVEAVRQWPTPTRQKEVEQFLGLAGYYRRFIKDFSKIAAPLSELCGTLKRGPGAQAARRAPPTKAFYWESAQQQSFEALKAAVSDAPCLAMPDPSREFIVHTDASGYATGAVLMQKFDEGLRPIAFLSKKMKAAERNYPVHEQELLAILTALRAWRHYLGGRRFTVLTDHQSLQYIEASAMATPRQMRWAAWLAEFDFAIRYAPGEKNVVADALSRAAAGGDGDAVPREQEAQRPLLVAIRALMAMPPIPVRVREAAAQDQAYQRLLGTDDDALTAQRLSRSGGLLYRMTGDATGGQLVVPDNGPLRAWLLSYAHDAGDSGHRGADRAYQWLRQRVWWSGMQTAAERYVAGCEECQRSKPDRRGRQGLPLSIDTPGRAGEVIGIDFIGPLPESSVGGVTYNAVMVVVDRLTRYAVYVPMATQRTAQSVFHKLDAHWIALFGAPSTIVSDRDTLFTSRFWVDIWAGLRAELKRSTAFHPQSDGQVEKQNGTLIDGLKTFVDERRSDWAVLLPQLQRAHNSSVCASTGHSPDKMMFGREMRAMLDAELEADGVAARGRYPGAIALEEQRQAALETARERIEQAQARQRAEAMRGRRPVDLAVGDRAWLANRNLTAQGPGGSVKLEPRYYGPYEVLEMHGPNAARLRMPDGCRLHPVFNTDLLKRYVDGRAEFPDRPQRFERPGPVPEEDPEAGGPASGAPVYEVDSVIETRGRGARKQYKVLWKDWPRQQASWLNASDCDGCAEAVADFERLQLAQRRRVHALQQQQVDHQQEVVTGWLARVVRGRQAAAAARVHQSSSTRTGGGSGGGGGGGAVADGVAPEVAAEAAEAEQLQAQLHAAETTQQTTTVSPAINDTLSHATARLLHYLRITRRC